MNFILEHWVGILAGVTIVTVGAGLCLIFVIWKRIRRLSREIDGLPALILNTPNEEEKKKLEKQGTESVEKRQFLRDILIKTTNLILLIAWILFFFGGGYYAQWRLLETAFPEMPTLTWFVTAFLCILYTLWGIYYTVWKKLGKVKAKGWRGALRLMGWLLPLPASWTFPDGQFWAPPFTDVVQINCRRRVSYLVYQGEDADGNVKQGAETFQSLDHITLSTKMQTEYDVVDPIKYAGLDKGSTHESNRGLMSEVARIELESRNYITLDDPDTNKRLVDLEQLRKSKLDISKRVYQKMVERDHEYGIRTAQVKLTDLDPPEALKETLMLMVKEQLEARAQTIEADAIARITANMIAQTPNVDPNVIIRIAAAQVLGTRFKTESFDLSPSLMTALGRFAPAIVPALQAGQQTPVSNPLPATPPQVQQAPASVPPAPPTPPAVTVPQSPPQASNAVQPTPPPPTPPQAPPVVVPPPPVASPPVATPSNPPSPPPLALTGKQRRKAERDARRTEKRGREQGGQNGNNP